MPNESARNPRVCGECGAPMRKRDGMYGEFFGCSRFPQCRFTQNLDEAPAEYVPKPKFEPSEFQKAIFNFIKDPNKKDAVVMAAAGSGKTTTIVQALKFAKGEVGFFAFNKSIANELRKKAPYHVDVSTLHSHGFKAICSAFSVDYRNSGDFVNQYKKWDIAKLLLPDVKGKTKEERRNYRYERGLLVKLTSLVQNTLTDPADREAIDKLIVHYNLELGEDPDLILNLLPRMIEECEKRVQEIDYDDMIWLPARLNIPVNSYDWLFIDEAQDLNKSQIHLMLSSVKDSGRVIAVGDKNQSIYGFRGADTEAIPNIIKFFNDTEILPLSITYRCPKSHVALAKQLVPELEAAPNAEEGEVRYDVPYVQALADIQAGDLCLCRLNAPLVKACYLLIRSGRKAVIRGRDIGKGLIGLIDKLDPMNIIDLSMKLSEYRRTEVAKFMAAEKESMISVVEDKCDTIEALMDGVNDLAKLRQNITDIFSDNVEGVVFSSVHRAKGLEADNVYVLHPEFMPFPKAAKAWELDQERNILYVAITRAKKLLVFIEGRPQLSLAASQAVSAQAAKELQVENEMQQHRDEIDTFVANIYDRFDRGTEIITQDGDINLN